MHIILNGEQLQSSCRSLMDLITDRGIAPDALIAEVNYTIIKQSDWPDYLLREGDRVELLNFVGGG